MDSGWRMGTWKLIKGDRRPIMQLLSLSPAALIWLIDSLGLVWM